MGIKLVISDIDGTLIGSDRKIQPVMKEIGEFIKKQNIRFVLATGRILSRTEELKPYLGDEIPVIGCNGSCAQYQGRYLWNDFIQGKYLKDAIKKADELGLSVVFTDGIKEYAYRKTEWVRELMEKYNRYDGVFMPSEEEWDIQKIQKVLISDVKEKDQNQQVLRLLERHPDEMSVVCYPDGTLDVMPKTASKGVAVQRIAEFFNVKKEEIMAIGDHENDLDMIQYAGIGIAVGNATPSLKKQATYVCKAEMAEGVLEALKYYF